MYVRARICACPPMCVHMHMHMRTSVHARTHARLKECMDAWRAPCHMAWRAPCHMAHGATGNRAPAGARGNGAPQALVHEKQSRSSSNLVPPSFQAPQACAQLFITARQNEKRPCGTTRSPPLRNASRRRSQPAARAPPCACACACVRVPTLVRAPACSTEKACEGVQRQSARATSQCRGQAGSERGRKSDRFG